MVTWTENLELIQFLREILSSELTIALLLFSLLDWLTGLFSSFVLKTTSSKIGMTGILRKILLYLSIVAIAIASYIFRIEWLVHMFKMFFIANEIISILENLTASGINLPQGLLEIFSYERERYERQISKEKLNTTTEEETTPRR